MLLPLSTNRVWGNTESDVERQMEDERHISFPQLIRSLTLKPPPPSLQGKVLTPKVTTTLAHIFTALTTSYNVILVSVQLGVRRTRLRASAEQSVSVPISRLRVVRPTLSRVVKTTDVDP
ncbi:hypothetical protein F2P81_012479 [Scophthalmus maximus]|uniref:Uncharacterized protein n=1 Tax=Scophthalmus maximus TaxID=52904 RepID=A0A6A4SUK1_SCOMX|nr:hypothetical protein F2P81_012479 [Scophthalmus maximus]